MRQHQLPINQTPDRKPSLMPQNLSHKLKYLAAIALIAGVAAFGLSPQAYATQSTNPAATDSVQVNPANPKPVTNPETKKLSLEQAVDLAMQNNADIKAFEAAIAAAQITCDQADYYVRNAVKDGLIKVEADGTVKFLRPIDQSGYMAFVYTPAAAKLQMDDAKTQKIAEEAGTKYQVTSAYYNLQNATKLLACSKTSLERANKQLSDANAKFKVGTIAKLEVSNAEQAVKTAQADLNKSQDNIALAQMNLALAIGLPLNTPIVATTVSKFEAIKAPIIEEILPKVYEQDGNLSKLRLAWGVANLDYQYQKKYFTENTFDYQFAEANFKTSDINYNNYANVLEMMVRSKAATLKSAEANYKVLASGQELARESYRLTKLQFDAGLTTMATVIAAQERFEQAELGVQAALLDYNLAKASFKYLVFPVGQ